MKEIFEDYENENFTRLEWLVYGLLVPAVFVAVAIFAGSIFF